MFFIVWFIRYRLIRVDIIVVMVGRGLLKFLEYFILRVKLILNRLVSSR